MSPYNPKDIELKWQKKWEEEQLFFAKDFDKKREKFYHLVMFPYPSGNLHMGHWYNFTGADVVARKKFRDGYNIMSPMGFDAFGLPAENAAIKRKIHPKEWTLSNIETMRGQIRSAGFMYDWSRDVVTCLPQYYKWTQWLFLKMFERGLAYRKKAAANWCPKDQTVLANEQIVDGKCERCDAEVVQKEIDQWLLKTTDYAERLLNDLDGLDWPEKTKAMQRNWIGKSEGALVKFQIPNSKFQIEVFTTRADTLFGATYMVLAPEHPLVANKELRIKNYGEVEKYVEATKKKTELERLSEGKEKTGVELEGVKAVNPANGEEIPVYISDYVLASYGTGAIMAVPAHDERDFEFAKKFKLPIKQVIAPVLTVGGASAPQEGKQLVKRTVVSAIIHNPATGKYLILRWPNGETGLVGGGVEDGETAEQAIMREVKEETGYVDFTIKQQGFPIFYGYGYKARKDVNCFDYESYYIIELLSEQQKHLHDGDAGSHEYIWVEEKYLAKSLTLSHHRELWGYYKNNVGCYAGEGILIHSDEFSGLLSEEAKKKIVKMVGGKHIKTYKLRDWLISRQRYWGAPIPIVHCESCGTVPVPEKDLPVLLPDDVDFQPTGESPLARHSTFPNVKCPNCGKDAKRETDTMDTFVDSSWYFFRYTDPKNEKEFASRKHLDYWMKPKGVDLYIGGAEHTVMHLLYARFFTKVLFDAKLSPVDEPFGKLRHQGIILGPDGQKMSKSKGNVADPDELVRDFGADAVRMYLMFMGPFDLGGPWNPRGLNGIRRFLDRVWKLAEDLGNGVSGLGLEILRNKTIKKVTEDIEQMKFHTAIASLMEYANTIEERKEKVQADTQALVHLLSPFAPHITEEIWSSWGNKTSVFLEKWPAFDVKKTEEAIISFVVQFNGKTRGLLRVARGILQDEIFSAVGQNEKLKKYLTGKPKKIIFIKDKIINIVL